MICDHLFVYHLDDGPDLICEACGENVGLDLGRTQPDVWPPDEDD